MSKKSGGNSKTASGDTHAKQALEALDRLDYHLAVRELTQAIEDGVAKYNLAELYTILGKTYKNLGQFDQAIAAHEQAIKIDPKCYRAWNNLGIVHFSRNNYAEAERCYQKALAIEPQYAFAIASLGALYINRNHPEKAIEVSEQAIALVPTMAVAHSNLAQAYAMVGRFEEADRALKQAVLFGYKDWQTIQEKIDSLKQMGEKTAKAPRTEWLPAICPRCGAPVSAATVVWTSRNTADCAYCGTNIERKPRTQTPQRKELLTEVYWALGDRKYTTYQTFVDAVTEYNHAMAPGKHRWDPDQVVSLTPIKVVYEAFWKDADDTLDLDIGMAGVPVTMGQLLFALNNATCDFFMDADTRYFEGLNWVRGATYELRVGS
ncbi:MAG TPA: tetratricopeptide repeat protein [Anaerolineae bacterium]|nr:tetratricopeptide repeat protein [Anaerolineae bacterium]